MWVYFLLKNDRVSGVPKAAKNNQNCVSSKYYDPIAMIILLHLLNDNRDHEMFFYWSSKCDVLLPVIYKYEPYT